MILIINVCKEKLHYYEFVKPVEDILRKSEIDFFTKYYSKVRKEDLENAEKIIICGTSLKDNKFIDDVNYFKWIEDCDKPILGICAGMQIIGIIFGGKLEKNKEIGLERINFKKEFLGVKSECEVYCLHGNSIKFSKGFEVFAKSKDCVEAVKHKEKKVYGVLFHPEVGNKNIILNFCEI